MVTRGFTGRGSGSNQADRVPPGQHLEAGFPVLSAGPTPLVDTADWKFTVKIGPKPAKVWNWSQFNALPKTKVTRDIHCVTSWSKLDEDTQPISAALATNNSASSSMKFTQMGKENMTCSQ